VATPAVLELLFKADTSGVESAATKTKGLIGGVVDSLGKIGLAGLGVGAIKGVFDSAAGSIGGLIAASEGLADAQARVSIVFSEYDKNAAKIAEDNAQVANSLGLTKEAYLSSVGALGDFVTNMGVGQEAAFNMATDLTELAPKLAAFAGVDTEQAMAALEKGVGGATRGLKEMGIAIDTDAISKLSDADKAVAIFDQIMQQSSGAVEAWAGNQADVEVSMQRISAAMDDAKAAIGDRLLPAIAPLVEAMANALPGAIDAAMGVLDMLSPVFDGVVSAMEPVADAVGRFMEGFQNGADDGMMPFTSALSGVAEMLDGLIPEPIVEGIRNFAGAFEQAAEVLSGSKDEVSSYNPVVQSLGDIFVLVGQTIATWVDNAKAVFQDVQGAIGVLAEFFREKFELIRSKVDEAWAWLNENVFPIVAGIVDTVVEKVTELKDEFYDKFGSIQGFVQTVVDWFNTHVQPTLVAVFDRVMVVVGSVVTFFRDNLPAIQAIVSGVFDVIVGVIQTAFSIIKGVVEIGMAVFRGDWSAAWEAAKTMVSGAWDGIKKILGGLKDFLFGLGSIVLTEAGKIAQNIIDGLKGGLERGWSAVTGWIDDQIAKIPEGIKKILGVASPSKVMADIGENVTAGFRLGLAGMEEVIQWLHDTIAKSIGSKDVNSLEQVMRAVVAIRDTTQAVLDTIELLMADLPDTSAMADRFRSLIGGFEGVIEKMRQISLFADKDKLPEFGYQLSKWDVANVNAVSGALQSIAGLIKGLADAVKAASDIDNIDRSVFDKVKIAAEAVGAIAVELGKSFASSLGTEGAAKAAGAIASSIKAYADVLKTVADLKLGDIAEIAADGLDAVKVNAARLKDALFTSTEAFQAASDKALDHGVKAVEAFAAYVKAAADAFGTAGAFKLGDVTALTAADMVKYQANARVLIGALWQAAQAFVEASEKDLLKTERGVGAFVGMIQSAADALSAGKAAADALAEATEITSASITRHLVHLRDVVIPAVVGVVNGWGYTNAEAERMTERIETFAALMGAAVGAHDGIPRGKLETAIEIDKSALVRYLTRMRELIIPAVVEVVREWDMANDEAKEWSERVDVFAKLMAAVVGANEAIPHERSLIGMNINVANLTKHLTQFRDKYIPALDAVLQGWRMAEDVSKELLARAGSFLALMKAVTDAEGAIPKLAEKQAGYAEISADAFKAALLHVRDKLIPALDFVLQGFTYSEKVAADLLTRATAFTGMLDAIVKAYAAITSLSTEAPRTLSAGALDGFKASAVLLLDAMRDVMSEAGLSGEVAAARAAAADAVGAIAGAFGSVLDVVDQALSNPFGRIRATGQRGDTLRTNLKERVKASLTAAVQAIQEAAAGLSFTLPEGLADKMAALADAFRPILEIIEGLRGGIDLRALRQLAMAPGILAAGLSFQGGEINGSITGDTANVAGMTINLDVQPTLVPLTQTTENTINVNIGDRTIEKLSERVAQKLDIEIRKR